MTKKEIVMNAIKAEMTGKELTNALATIDFEVKVSVAKNDQNVRNIYDKTGKNKFASVTIVAEAPKNEKKSRKSNKEAKELKEYKNKNADLYASCDRTPVKEVGNGYVIFYAMKSNKEGEVYIVDDITTCAQIKEFIKKLHSEGKVSVLNIYKMGENYAQDNKDIHKTRISAWVGDEVVLTA